MAYFFGKTTAGAPAATPPTSSSGLSPLTPQIQNQPVGATDCALKCKDAPNYDQCVSNCQGDTTPNGGGGTGCAKCDNDYASCKDASQKQYDAGKIDQTTLQSLQVKCTQTYLACKQTCGSSPCNGFKLPATQTSCPPSTTKRVFQGETWCCQGDVPPGGGGDCGTNFDTTKMDDGKGVYAGCTCGRNYYPALHEKGNTCPPGYIYTKTDAKGYRCECQKWCNDIGYASDCVTKTGAGSSALGEFSWPPEMQAFYKSLMGRGQDILNQPYGFTDQAIANQFGQGFDKIRGEQAATGQTVMNNLSSQGLLGTGTQTQAVNQNAWAGQGNVSNLMRDVFLQNETQKRKDEELYTNLANTLFGSGMGFNQILEAINASRRGEGLNALQLWLQYMSQLSNTG